MLVIAETVMTITSLFSMQGEVLEDSKQWRDMDSLRFKPCSGCCTEKRLHWACYQPRPRQVPVSDRVRRASAVPTLL